ncbi:SPOR domain-containing protein [Cytobacillus massiliigabonensis]|uniref:SPOR domain-containing protein n=1 Tax=Cytobacillus massiliigabonensis TaxID=1871011 RepID=UPI000C85ACC9|nr:SPOR domain-containing protein [Cytobacillus massiliigabonensis]
MVDREEKGKTITIKINGKNHTFNEIVRHENERMKVENHRDLLIEETDHNNKYDYSSAIEAAASKEAADEENFDWILPDESSDFDMDVQEYKMAKQPKKQNQMGIGAISKNFKKNNRNGMLSSVFLTVFFAILLGTSFGLLLLKLVITENEIAADQPVIAEPIPEKTEDTPAGGTESMTLEPLSTFVVQGGVFSNKEAAEQMKDGVAQLGAPAQLVEMNGQAILYLSVADSIELAKDIGAQLKSRGIEVFAKPITFDSKAMKDLQGEERKIMEAAGAIYQSIAAGASEAAASQTVSPPTLEKAEKQASILKGIDEDKLKHEGVIAIKTELNQAIEQLRAYNKSPDPSIQTKLQQHLLGFLAAYHSL